MIVETICYRIIDIYIFTLTKFLSMSRQPTSGQSSGIVSSFFDQRISRIARKSPNPLNLVNQKDNSKIEMIEAIQPSSINAKTTFQRKKELALGQNAAEQSTNPSTVSKSANPSKITQQIIASKNDSEVNRKATGLFSNALKGSVNTFIKGKGLSTLTTANMNKEEPQQKNQTQITQLVLPKSVTSASKLNRSKAKQTQISDLSIKSKVNNNYESGTKPDTDRIMIQSNKKIQRRTGSTRQLKFVEKHIEKQEEIVTEPKVVPTIQQTKLSFNNQVKTSNTIPSRLVRNKPESKNIEEILTKQKEKQQLIPVPNINPRYLNRTLPQKITQPKIQEVIIEKKIEPAKIINPKQNMQQNRQTETKLIQLNTQPITNSLKKTAVIVITIKRLFKNTLQGSFYQLKNNKIISKFKNVNNCTLLYFALNQIVKNKEVNLLRNGFQSVKRKFTYNYIIALKPSVQFTFVNFKFTAVGLIERVYLSKLRLFFKRIAKSPYFVDKISKSFTILLTLFKKKTNNFVKRSYNQIKQRGQNRYYVLLQLNNSLLNINKQAYNFTFSKIKLANLKPASITQQSKIKSSPKVFKEQIVTSSDVSQQHFNKLSNINKNKAEINKEISCLQQKIRTKKELGLHEKESYALQIQVFNNHKDQINHEILLKKQRNDKIKEEMTKIKIQINKNNQNNEQFQSRQNKLQFLTDIYIQNLQNAEDKVSVETFVENYSLKPNDGCTILTEWQAILANVELKRILAVYRQENSKDKKARTNLIDEQRLIIKMVRSYIKEQFYWTWIHHSAQNL